MFGRLRSVRRRAPTQSSDGFTQPSRIAATHVSGNAGDQAALEVESLRGSGLIPHNQLVSEVWPLPVDGGGSPRFFRVELPTWVRPARHEMSDCYWLAYRAHLEYLAGDPGAVAATLAWVAGGEPAPMTGRREQPVTRALAEVESWSTSAFDRVPALVEDLCVRLGVEFVPVLVAEHVTPEWAQRVWRTLRWLTSEGPHGHGVDPPIAVPARNPDGSLASAEELYAVAVARWPFHYDAPEQRFELRNRVGRIVERSRQLDQILRETKRAAGVDAA